MLLLLTSLRTVSLMVPGLVLRKLLMVGSDDIVRARLRTLGVEEHRFTMETGMSLQVEVLIPILMTTRTGASGSEWYIYDVGGSRNVVRHLQHRPLF